jgi:hypothetical protein
VRLLVRRGFTDVRQDRRLGRGVHVDVCHRPGRPAVTTTEAAPPGSTGHAGVQALQPSVVTDVVEMLLSSQGRARLGR